MESLIVDTSALLAYFDASEPDHALVTETVSVSSGLLVVSPYVVAKLDYLVGTRHGVAAELAVLGELAAGAWELPAFGTDDILSAGKIIHECHDQEIGIADASNVELAERYKTKQVATLDRRHFEVLKPLSGGSFRLLP